MKIWLGVVGLAMLVAGCAANGPVGFFQTPGKYDNVECVDLVKQTQAAKKRVDELSGRIDQAGADSFGGVVGGLVYGPELASARENLQFLQVATAEKKCEFPAQPSPANTRLTPVSATPR